MSRLPCNRCGINPKRAGSGQRYCSEECSSEARKESAKVSMEKVKHWKRNWRLRQGVTPRAEIWREDGARRCANCEEYKDPSQFKSGYCVDCLPAVARARSLFYKYKLTVEQYDAMLANQGGACAICLEDRPLNVDHDHSCCPGERSCGKCVRGLLCRRCNYTILGAAKDDPELLRRASDYVRVR